MKPASATVLLPVLLLSAIHAQADGLFTFSNGTFTTIPIPAVYSDSTFGGINDAGQIVGTNNNIYILQGLLYSGGTFSTFSYPGQSSFDAVTIGLGINDGGQISGEWGALGPRGYIDTGGAFSSISAPGAGYAGTYVTGINNDGQVVGYFNTFTNQGFLFIYSGGSFTTIPATAGSGTPNAINDAGQIVGSSHSPNSPGNSFEYSSGTFSTIAFPGASTTTATGINDSGEIVGSFLDSNGNSHGFIDNGGVYSEIDYPNALDTYITGLNDNGELVGAFTDTPEPGSLLLCGFGFAAASFASRKLTAQPPATLQN